MTEESGTYPTSPVSWSGVPLLYKRASPTPATAPSVEGTVPVPHPVGLTVAEARGLLSDMGPSVQGSRGEQLADDAVMADQIPEAGAPLSEGSIVQVDT